MNKMKATDLKQQYKKETGRSCMNPNTSVCGSFYTDDYTEWLEKFLLKSLEPNIELDEEEDRERDEVNDMAELVRNDSGRLL